MISVDSATLLQKVPTIWCPLVSLCLQTVTIPTDKIKCAPNFTGQFAKIRTSLLRRSGYLIHNLKLQQKISASSMTVIPVGRFLVNGAIKPDIVVWDRKDHSVVIIDFIPGMPDKYQVRVAAIR